MFLADDNVKRVFSRIRCLWTPGGGTSSSAGRPGAASWCRSHCKAAAAQQVLTSSPPARKATANNVSRLACTFCQPESQEFCRHAWGAGPRRRTETLVWKSAEMVERLLIGFSDENSERITTFKGHKRCWLPVVMAVIQQLFRRIQWVLIQRTWWTH